MWAASESRASESAISPTATSAAKKTRLITRAIASQRVSVWTPAAGRWP
jgi:hypothetical protein